MTGEQFVELCFKEKVDILNTYFSSDSQSEVAEKIKVLTQNGADRDLLYELVSLVMNESYYTLLLALDGEASLGGEQMCYRIFDENDTLLNECGEIEEAAFRYFMES